MSQRSLMPDVVPHEAQRSGYVVRPSGPVALLSAAFGGVAFIPVDRSEVAAHIDTKADARSARTAGGCEHPIRLAGESREVNGNGVITDTGSVSAYASCKTRRATRCEPCSVIYQHDARHLIVSGLRGGKGTNDEVAQHPALFATFTAPSFGVVHGHRNGQVCRPRRDADTCPHGRSLACWAVHTHDDKRLGQALCFDCYDYSGAVLWNNASSALWRVTRIGVDRALAAGAGMTPREARQLVRTQYVKVAEFQARGLVHFHVAIRLDGTDGAPPEPFDQDALETAIRTAATNASVERADGERVTWGDQLDLRPITPEDSENETNVSRRQVAGYLAKYATKGSDVEGRLDRRFRNEDDLACLRVNDHLARMVRTSWRLARKQEDARLDAWSHQLGYRGHFLTKSRNWSTTFKALRQARVDHQAELREKSWAALSEETTRTIVARWSYTGSGYRTPAEDWAAEIVRAQRRSERAA